MAAADEVRRLDDDDDAGVDASDFRRKRRLKWLKSLRSNHELAVVVDEDDDDETDVAQLFRRS